MKENGFLIRMMYAHEDSPEEEMIKAFYSKDITELVKLYKTAKDYEIPVCIPSEIKNKSKWDGYFTYVQDLSINFGGHESMQGLDIWVSEPLNIY